MGFFSFWKKKKEKDNTEFQQITVEEALKKYGPAEAKVSAMEVLKQTEDACIQVLEVERQLEEAKQEYAAVTSYLSDMQRIDLIPVEERENIDDAARKIINLTKERLKFKNNKHSISDAQYHYLERFEDDIPKELERIKEQERYQLLVKNDLRQLEGEKGVFSYERESAILKRDFLKRLSMVGCVLVLSVFLLLFVLSNSLQKDMTIPFFITGLMALSMTLYIILESKRSIYRLRMAEMKLNKVVALTNKIKIKYVNSTSTLEYTYEKYRVNGYQELCFLWQEFVKAKDEAERFKKNTDLLEGYNEVLIEELKERGIVDAEVWTFQPEALLDKKEMVEVRHRLNNRRQKLREQIDFNSKQRDISKNGLLSLKRSYQQYQSEIEEMIQSFGIIC